MIRIVFVDDEQSVLEAMRRTLHSMRAVGTAHQYLAKPCSSEALKGAISTTHLLRSILSSERLAPMVAPQSLMPHGSLGATLQ